MSGDDSQGGPAMVNPLAHMQATLRSQFWTRVRANAYEVAAWLTLGLVDWRIAGALALLQLAVYTRLKASAMGGGL